MLLGDGTHDEKAQTGSFDVRDRTIGNSIEALENALQLRRRNAASAVLDAQPHTLFVGGFNANGNIHLIAGILDRVVQQIRDGGAQLRRIADDDGFVVRGCGLKTQRLRLKMMSCSGHFDAIANQFCKIDGNAFAAALSVSRYGGFEHLLDGAQETIGVVKHAAVKLAALRLVDVTMLQRLQVKADGCNRGLEFVRDRVDETVVLLVAANLAQQKNCIEDQPGRNGTEENHAQKNFDAFTPIEYDPAESDSDGDAGETNA